MIYVIGTVIALLILAIVAVFVYRNNKKKLLAVADAAADVADKVVSAADKAKDIAEKLKR